MDPGDEKELTAAGRVLGADGKPLPGVEVALVGWGRLSGALKFETDVLARGKTDEQGRFRLTAKDLAAKRAFQIHLVAGGKGLGLAWLTLRGHDPRLPFRSPPALDKLEVKVAPGQILRGRMFDLQGLPAKGVTARVVYAARKLDPDSKDPAVRDAQQWLSMKRRTDNARVFGEPITPMRTPLGLEFLLPEPPAAFALWPRPFTTDAEGRFTLRGFAADLEIHLLIDDDRFAQQELKVELPAKPAKKEVNLSLAAPRRIEGRVTYGDTGKPVAGALVISWMGGTSTPKEVRTVADAEGRYALNPYPGSMFQVTVLAPRDQPYLNAQTNVSWIPGTVKRTVDLPLPRGVTVRGKVIEAPSGKPVARAQLQFTPQRIGALRERDASLSVRSGEDGSFRLVIPQEPGRLLVDAGDPNLIPVVMSFGELMTGKPSGLRQYYDAVIPLDLKAKDDPKEIEVKLRRGVTLRGRVVGPDGKPVAKGFVFCHPEALRPQRINGMLGLMVGDQPFGQSLRVLQLVKGEFELHGCDPDRTYPVYITDAPPEAGPVAFRPTDANQVVNVLFRGGKDRLGATALIGAKQAAGKPLTVRLAPSGSAEVRFVDAKGKPAKARPTLDLRLAAGAGKVDGEWLTVGMPQDARRLMMLPGMRADGQVTLNPKDKGPFLLPDAEGRMTIPALIPGATYRLRGYDERDPGVVHYEREFTAESGKTLRLADLVVP
jgi:hypothetical protein